MDAGAGAVGKRFFDLIRCGASLRLTGLITTKDTKSHEVLRAPSWLKTYRPRAQQPSATSAAKAVRLLLVNGPVEAVPFPRLFATNVYNL